MSTDSGSTEGKQPEQFVDRDLSGARFVRSDLSRAVMRGVDLQGADIDAPWLMEEGGSLLVNGVDVAPLVDAELDRRYPGRSERTARDPEGLRRAYARLQDTWAATIERAGTMPAGTVDESVDGEWSFAQTLRHLVLATDTWLGKAVLRKEKPFHPLGMPHAEYESDGNDMSVFATEQPSYAEVLEARADRVAMVRTFLAGATPELLDEERRNPHDPQYPETVRSCLHVVLGEEWEHHRYAVRDLDTIAARGTGSQPPD